jgi:DNA-binding NtrC family response regulator
MTASNPTILLVDDEDDQRKRMSTVLRNAGYQMILASDYPEAKAQYQRFRGNIDLLLIDVSIPGNNGCELAKEARATDPRIKSLLISGHTGAYVCRFYGIAPTDVHFLGKPFSTEDLLSRVKQVLEYDEPMTDSASATAW